MNSAPQKTKVRTWIPTALVTGRLSDGRAILMRSEVKAVGIIPASNAAVLKEADLCGLATFAMPPLLSSPEGGWSSFAEGIHRLLVVARVVGSLLVSEAGVHDARGELLEADVDRCLGRADRILRARRQLVR